MNPLFLKKIDRFFGLLSRAFPCSVKTGFRPDFVSHILIIRPGGIGDAVLLIPAIKLLQQVFPAARIEVLAEKRNSGAFALCPGIAQVFCYDKPSESVAVLARRYDVVIDTEQWHCLSALVARMTRSQMKIGFGTNKRGKLFTHSVGYDHDRYELNSFFDLLSPLNLESPVTITYPYLTISAVDQKSVDTRLKNLPPKPFIAIFPGASISERCWGAQKFHSLAVRLFDHGFAVVVVGGREDLTVGDAILDGICGLNLAGKTSLSETAGVLNRSQLLISGDSGILHLGVGLGISTVSLFGPGIAGKWAPRGEQHAVINHKLPCSPCTKFGNTPPCPIGARCIQNISVDEVFIAVRKISALQ